MSDLPLELICPKCGIEVQPIEAAGTWFCPHCARPFTEAEITGAQVDQQRQPGSGEEPPPTE
jgi:predicted amidophosphoribosyltransferase